MRLFLIHLESHLGCILGVLCSAETFPFSVIYKASVKIAYGRNYMMQLEDTLCDFAFSQRENALCLLNVFILMLLTGSSALSVQRVSALCGWRADDVNGTHRLCRILCFSSLWGLSPWHVGVSVPVGKHAPIQQDPLQGNAESSWMRCGDSWAEDRDVG